MKLTRRNSIFIFLILASVFFLLDLLSGIAFDVYEIILFTALGFSMFALSEVITYVSLRVLNPKQLKFFWTHDIASFEVFALLVWGSVLVCSFVSYYARSTLFIIWTTCLGGLLGSVIFCHLWKLGRSNYEND